MKKRLTVLDIQKIKEKGERLAMVTCYDATFAKIINKTRINIVLVGDSLGNVMLGHENTTRVTMDDMVRFAAAVDRSLTSALLCVDMPFLSYQVSVEQALHNASRLIQEAGAQCVKVEGAKNIIPQVRALVDAGIPVMGHLGFTPQSIHGFGGYYVQGKDKVAGDTLIEDAKALEGAGAFAVVLEMVPAALAEEVTKALRIPTIGIGAGPSCDGQVLVLQDLLGCDSSFSPKFLKKYANLEAIAIEALDSYCGDVKEGRFPSPEHSYSY